MEREYYREKGKYVFDFLQISYKDDMKLSKNKTVSMNLISTIVLQGLTFFTTPIFSKLLGPSNYGIASVYQTWVMLISAIFSLQAGGAVGLALNEFPKSEQHNYRFNILVLIIGSFILFSIPSFLLGFFWKIDLLLLSLAIIHAFGFYCVQYYNSINIFEFRADLNLYTAISVSVFTIVSSLILVIFMPDEINYMGRIYGQSIPYFIIGLCICKIIIEKDAHRINLNYWKYTIPITSPIVFHVISNLILGQSDRIMLQQMCDNASVGIYTLSVTFSSVIQSLWNAFNTSWVAFYYEYSAKEEIQRIRISTFNYLEFFTVIVCGFILLSPEVFNIFAPKDFITGIKYVPVFALGYLFVFFYSFPVNYEFFNKQTRIIAFITSLTAAINIILNYILIKYYQVYGAVLATTIAHGIQFLLHYYSAKKMKKSLFPYKIWYFMPSLIAVFICILLFYLNIHWELRWIIALIIGIIEARRIYFRKSIY